MDAERPFVSAVTGNASGTTSSGATHSDRAVRGDANLVQICAGFASLRMLSGRAKCPLGPRTGPPGRDTGTQLHRLPRYYLRAARCNLCRAVLMARLGFRERAQRGGVAVAGHLMRDGVRAS
jgi:hypothetical protein